MPDPATLVERALESVLDQVPDSPDFSVPETSGRIQPWADVAAPAGKNKRPLEELLAEYQERVLASPGARAELPTDKPGGEVFYERFERGSGGGGTGRRRRRKPRRGGPGPSGEAQPANVGQGPGRRPSGGERRPENGPNPNGPRRPHRRGRRGRGPRPAGGPITPSSP